MIELVPHVAKWPWAPLGDICEIRGGFPAPQGENAFASTGIPFVRMKDVGRYHFTNDLHHTDSCLSPEHFASGRYALTPKGAILMPRSGSVALNHRAILTVDAVIVSHLCALVPTSPQIDTGFLYRFLCLADMRKLTKKTTGLDSIAFSDLKQVAVPLPSLAEQRRIAMVLDRAEALSVKRRAALAQFEELSSAVFLDLFGEPRTNPRGWPLKTLGDLCSRITKGESPNWQGFAYQDNGALFVTSENVRLGRLDISAPKFVPIAFHAKLTRSSLKVGDVLVNLVGASIGRSCIFAGWDGPANVNQAVAVLSTKPEWMDPSYLGGLLASPTGQRWLLGNRVEAARANISLSDLRQLEVPVPPLELQHHFAALVGSVELLRKTQVASSSRLDSLRRTLQDRAFRGEL